MNFELRKNLTLIALLVMTAATTYFSFKMGLSEKDVSERVEALWMVIFAVLVALWAVNDALDRELDVSFSYGFLLFIFWPLTLAYHMYRTRSIDGIHSYFGFATMYILPSMSWLYAYAYYS